MTIVNVLDGDVVQILSDALITAINSGGMWFGAIDNAIMRAAGNSFHAAAERQMPLRDGQVVHATSAEPSRAAFKSVMFVVDDLQQPLGGLLLAALYEAGRLGLSSVSVPLMRTGVMAGQFETPLEAVGQMAEAIRQFLGGKPSTVQAITVVAYRQAELSSYLRGQLAGVL